MLINKSKTFYEKNPSLPNIDCERKIRSRPLRILKTPKYYPSTLTVSPQKENSSQINQPKLIYNSTLYNKIDFSKFKRISKLLKNKQGNSEKRKKSDIIERENDINTNIENSDNPSKIFYGNFIKSNSILHKHKIPYKMNSIEINKLELSSFVSIPKLKYKMKIIPHNFSKIGSCKIIDNPQQDSSLQDKNLLKISKMKYDFPSIFSLREAIQKYPLRSSRYNFVCRNISNFYNHKKALSLCTSSGWYYNPKRDKKKESENHINKNYFKVLIRPKIKFKKVQFNSLHH